MNSELKAKKPWYKKWWVWLLAIIVIGGIGSGGDEETDAKAQPEKSQPAKAEQAASSEFVADLKLAVEGTKVIATINTNAPDGAVFETYIMNGKMETKSDYITIAGGKAVKEFDVNGWSTGYISGSSMFRFDLKEHPQPADIVEHYGAKGEKLEGKLVQTVHDGFKTATLEIATVPYPNAQAVAQMQDEYLSSALTELINASSGVVLKLQPAFQDDDWSAVHAVISDTWYNSQEYEKERFALQLSEAVGNIVHASGKVAAEDSVRVYLYDAYDQELATPKMMGGYKIKR